MGTRSAVEAVVEKPELFILHFFCVNAVFSRARIGGLWHGPLIASKIVFLAIGKEMRTASKESS